MSSGMSPVTSGMYQPISQRHARRLPHTERVVTDSTRSWRMMAARLAPMAARNAEFSTAPGELPRANRETGNIGADDEQHQRDCAANKLHA